MSDNIHIVARAVIISNGSIALCRTIKLKSNFYFLPGGHIEHKDGAKSTVIRELLEEGGHEFEVKRFLGCLEFSFEPMGSGVCHDHEYNLIFECFSKNITNDTKFLKLEKDIEIIWVPLNEIPSIDFKPEIFKTLIPKWLNQNLDDAFASVMI